MNNVFDFIPVAELDMEVRECWMAQRALETIIRSVHDTTTEMPKEVGISTQYDLFPWKERGLPHVGQATYVDKPLMQCLVMSYVPVEAVVSVWMLCVGGVWYIVAHAANDNYYVLSNSLIIGMFN